jgi:hypothetical protein
MANKKMPTGASVATAQIDIQSASVPILERQVQAGRIEVENMHRATAMVAESLVDALTPYANGSILNSLVVNGLAQRMTPVSNLAANLAGIVDVFAVEVQVRNENAITQGDDAIALLSAWEGQLDEGQQYLNGSAPLSIAPAVDEWAGEVAGDRNSD